MFKIDKKYNELIIVDNISIYSICEHHFLPFIGKAKFSYIPKDKIIGLSKIPRIIDYLSRNTCIKDSLMLFVLALCWWNKTCINDKLVNSEDMRTEAKFIESVVIV
jgi:GTP cyclohydrolase I